MDERMNISMYLYKVYRNILKSLILWNYSLKNILWTYLVQSVVAKYNYGAFKMGQLDCVKAS